MHNRVEIWPGGVTDRPVVSTGIALGSCNRYDATSQLLTQELPAPCSPKTWVKNISFSVSVVKPGSVASAVGTEGTGSDVQRAGTLLRYGLNLIGLCIGFDVFDFPDL